MPDPTTGALVPYIRQSRRRERTISIDEQRRAITAWATTNGVPLAAEVIEEGVSGSKPWRDRELGRVIAACERGEVAGIVVSFQDRLSRESGLATAEVWESLERCGARLVCASEGLDTATGDSELVFSIKSAIARDGWKRSKRNWADARRNAVARGIHPSPAVPFGYTRNGDRLLVPDPVTADTVRNIYRLRAEGTSWNEICGVLDRTGVRPANGSHWVAASVAKIVRSPVYLGEAFHGEYRNPHAHEPLVTRPLWLAAQKRFPGRVTRGTEGSRLSGLVECAGCGGRMSPGGGHYRCLPRRSVHRDACESPGYAREDLLDAFVVAAFHARYDPVLGTMHEEVTQTQTTPEVTALHSRLERASHALDVLVGDPESLAALPSSQRTKLLANAQDEVDTARRELDAIEISHETSVINLFQIGDYFEPGGFRELDVRDQRRLLTAGIERVVVTRQTSRGEPPDGRTQIEWKHAS